MREEEEGREEGERENRCNRQERKDTKKGQVTKMPGFYREGPLGEGQPSLCDEEFKVGDRVCQSDPITGRDCGMLGEPGGQVHSDILSMDLSHLFPGVRLNTKY